MNHRSQLPRGGPRQDKPAVCPGPPLAGNGSILDESWRGPRDRAPCAHTSPQLQARPSPLGSGEGDEEAATGSLIGRDTHETVTDEWMTLRDCLLSSPRATACPAHRWCGPELHKPSPVPTEPPLFSSEEQDL